MTATRPRRSGRARHRQGHRHRGRRQARHRPTSWSTSSASPSRRSQPASATIAQQGRKFVPDLVAITVGRASTFPNQRFVPAQRVLAVAGAQVRSRLVQEGRVQGQAVPEARRRSTSTATSIPRWPRRSSCCRTGATRARQPTARYVIDGVPPAPGPCSRTRAASTKPASAKVTVIRRCRLDGRPRDRARRRAAARQQVRREVQRPGRDVQVARRP